MRVAGSLPVRKASRNLLPRLSRKTLSSGTARARARAVNLFFRPPLPLAASGSNPAHGRKGHGPGSSHVAQCVSILYLASDPTGAHGAHATGRKMRAWFDVGLFLSGVCGERADMRLTAEQQARAFAAYGVCANQACDRCGKVLAEIHWTRRDMPETYCSRLCRDGVERLNGQCAGCGVDLAGKRCGARWCSDTCRMRNRVKDSANNPKTRIQKIGLTATEINLGYDPTRTALFTDNPKRYHPHSEIARTGQSQ
jgi:hypothetical protein